jgi:hypothetical protein
VKVRQGGSRKIEFRVLLADLGEGRKRVVELTEQAEVVALTMAIDQLTNGERADEGRRIPKAIAHH